MIEDLFEKNRLWAEGKTARDPDYFRRLADDHFPDYFWIGCSDSRVVPNEVTGLSAGELFVHRNVANIASPSDPSFLSALQYAVDSLEVKHIIVCGHYGCGGVAAAMSDERHGLIDHWLQPIRDVADEFADHLLRITDRKERFDALCEANVAAQVRSVASNPIVQDAWRQRRELSIHGWIYVLETGRLQDLEISLSSFSDLASQFPSALSAQIGAPVKAREYE